MSGLTSVVIGIQARSTSERFPRKIWADIDGKPMIERVLDTCIRASNYLNSFSVKNGFRVTLCLLVPYGDEAKKWHQDKKYWFPLIEGSEHDVFSRYLKLAREHKPDVIVRVTADCPLLPNDVLSKHIKTAVYNGYDYLSNVDEGLRLAPDGFDCEVFSRKYLEWAEAESKSQEEREHVTLVMRKRPPEWAKIGLMTGFLDLSQLKISVDTEDDLARVRDQYMKIKQSAEQGKSRYGRTNIHYI